MTARPRADLAPPGFVEPQLALLVKEPPQGEGWAHEIKFDGYRMKRASRPARSAARASSC
jgi:bifunctional non-homologous end joining protein LigD